MIRSRPAGSSALIRRVADTRRHISPNLSERVANDMTHAVVDELVTDRVILTPQEVAVMLQLEVTDVERLHKSRKLKGRMFRGKLRFHRDAVAGYLDEWAEATRSRPDGRQPRTEASVGREIDGAAAVARVNATIAALKKSSRKRS